VDGTQTPYSAKDISLSLDIGDSTLRKWCLALEEHGYEFYRTDQNKRLFTDKDIIVLKYFQQLVKDKNMSMNNAALIVTSRFKKEVFSNETDVEQLEEEMNIVPAIRPNNELIQSLVTKISMLEEHQEQFIEMQKTFIKDLIQQHKNEMIEANRTLIQRLDEQQTYIEERLNKRDELLVESLRETLETKKLLIATAKEQELEKELQKNTRRGIFNWFRKA
jgi:Protein of unknown function (DUF3967)